MRSFVSFTFNIFSGICPAEKAKRTDKQWRNLWAVSTYVRKFFSNLALKIPTFYTKY